MRRPSRPLPTSTRLTLRGGRATTPSGRFMSEPCTEESWKKLKAVLLRVERGESWPDEHGKPWDEDNRPATRASVRAARAGRLRYRLLGLPGFEVARSRGKRWI